MIADRHLLVAPGAHIATGYVPIHKVRMACRERMAVGDVEAAFRRLLQTLPAQEWPPPNGHWEGDTFVVHDGRHAYVASLMLGVEHLLVAWVIDTPPTSSGWSSG